MKATHDTEASCVIIVSKNEAVRQLTRGLVEGLGRRVVTLEDTATLSAQLTHGPVPLVIIDIPHGADESLACIGAVRELSRKSDAGNTQVLALTRARSLDEFKLLFDEAEVTNFIMVREDDTLEVVDFRVTVSKLLQGHVFGLARYLQQGAAERCVTIGALSEKDKAVAMAQACALEAGCSERVTQSLTAVLDELMTNALYNAPVDADGRHTHAHLDRRTGVFMEPGREVLVRCAWDAHLFGISVEDQYGSLSRARVRANLKKCFAGGESQVDQKQGGAGLGLYMIFNMVNHFVLNIAPGTRTEAMGLVTISSSYKRVLARGHSFNLFLDVR